MLQLQYNRCITSIFLQYTAYYRLIPIWNKNVFFSFFSSLCSQHILCILYICNCNIVYDLVSGRGCAGVAGILYYYSLQISFILSYHWIVYSDYQLQPTYILYNILFDPTETITFSPVIQVTVLKNIFVQTHHVITSIDAIYHITLMKSLFQFGTFYVIHCYCIQIINISGMIINL